MRKAKLSLIGFGAASALALGGCSGDDSNAGPAGSADSGASSPGDGATLGQDASSAGDASSVVDAATPNDAGPPADTGAAADSGVTPAVNAVYTMSNAAAGNTILGFARVADGSLTPMAAPFPTGGAGSGAGLGEQGAVTYDRANNRLYAVNAGDNSVSMLTVNADGTLGAAVKVAAASGLLGPKSVTFHGDVVYVLYEGNATTASAIAGYSVTASGLTAIPGSTKALSSATQGVDPAQIQFTPDGSALVVTEKQSGAAGAVAGSGSLDLIAVGPAGAVTSIAFFPTASAGADAGLQSTPFGFDFVGDYLVVSEAGSTGTGVYTFAGGSIAPIPAGVQFLPTDPAPCWVVSAGSFAYVANARGPDVSGFTVSKTNGGLSPLGTAANAVVATTGKTLTTDAGLTFQGPTDESLSADGKYLYVLDSAVPAIGVFSIGVDGLLTRVGAADYSASAAALPVGVVGLASR